VHAVSNPRFEVYGILCTPVRSVHIICPPETSFLRSHCISVHWWMMWVSCDHEIKLAAPTELNDVMGVFGDVVGTFSHLVRYTAHFMWLHSWIFYTRGIY